MAGGLLSELVDRLMTVWPVGIGIYGMSHRPQKPGFIFSLRSQNCGPKFGLYSQTSCRDEFAGIELNSLPPSPRLLFARISSMYRNRLRKRNLMYCDVVGQILIAVPKWQLNCPHEWNLTIPARSYLSAKVHAFFPFPSTLLVQFNCSAKCNPRS
jgi:hypothetical protein